MSKKRSSERGAALVEMALVAPFLLTLLLGVIEFGFLFGQYNEVRHAAREGARYATVSNPDLDLNGDGTITTTDVVLATCDALNLPSGSTVTVTTTLSGTTIGSVATVQISATVSSLTGAPLISSFLPGQLDNTATFRLEQPATWSAGSGTC